MSVKYGTKSVRLTSADINQVVQANCTVLDSGNDPSDGSYYLKMQPNNGGCGATPNSKFYIELKDNIPWTKISYEVYIVGAASCWNFNQGGSYGLGNFLSFDTASGDRVFYSQNSFELPQFTTKMSACDNLSTNFYHGNFQVGPFRSFFVTRRRDTSNSNLANINIEISCNGAGSPNYILVRNIFVW